MRIGAVRSVVLWAILGSVPLACKQSGDQVSPPPATSDSRTVTSQAAVAIASPTTTAVVVVLSPPSTTAVVVALSPSSTTHVPTTTVAPSTSVVPAPPTTPAPPANTICTRSNIDFAALRLVPGVSSRLLAQIPPGDCSVILLTPDTVDAGGFPWYNVEWAGVQGWTAVSNMAS